MFDRKKYAREWRKNNKDKILKSCMEWKKNNRKKISERQKQYRRENIERVRELEKRQYIKHREKKLEQCKQYRQKNKEYYKEYFKEYKANNKEKRNEKEREKRRTDLKCSINHNISGVIRVSLKGNKKGNHWETLVGYTLIKLMKYLKKTMPKGYCWDDYLEGRLHIDHIIPISAFNFTKPEHTDFKRCWALENLQLLPARENLVKSNKLTKQFQPALQI